VVADATSVELGYDQLLAALPDPVVVVDTVGRLMWANAEAESVFGIRKETVQGRLLSTLIHPDDVVTAFESLATVQHKPLGSLVSIRLRQASRSYRHYEVRGRALGGPDGTTWVVLVLRDVTDRRHWEVDGGDVTRLRAIVDHAPGITMVIGADGRIRGASRALTSMLGRSMESSLGRTLVELIDPGDAPLVREEMAASLVGAPRRAFDATALGSNGERVPMTFTIRNLLDDQAVEGLVVTAVDVSALADAKARLEHMATHDQLTGLSNRHHLTSRLDVALGTVPELPVTLAFVDLDGFKAVNDRHGHMVGDLVLAEAARRIRAATPSADTVARLGGDEFVVVFREPQPAEVARLRAMIDEPIRLPDGVRAELVASIGMATRRPGEGAEDLLARADQAMYRDKHGHAARMRVPSSLRLPGSLRRIGFGSR
jgi:diguanylate cyclase (GGDEF)-like protein/PAS domain S-box-containing protein